jgi:hypothetical protein
MKIVSRAQLMELPRGTVWSWYEPSVIEMLMIKTNDPHPDYPDHDHVTIIDGLFDDEMDALERGEAVPLDLDNNGREGMYDEKQQYLVYDEDDVRTIIKALARTLAKNGEDTIEIS